MNDVREPFEPGPGGPDGDMESDGLMDGPGLCLSGGGSRAMLFHAGALIRLNELGLLARLGRVSSVSGGSITAGVLATRWSQLHFDPTTGVAPDFSRIVVDPIRRFAGRNVDVMIGIKGTLLPGGNPASRLADVLDEALYDGKTLEDLPGSADRHDQPGTPRFVFNATNVQAGSLWRFSKSYTRDWRVGKVVDGRTFPVAMAVAASSAFPPFFSPLRLDLRPDDFVADTSDPGLGDPRPFQQGVLLADGGVYDNLGLEPVIKRCRVVLVADGGGKLDDDATPATDWARQTLRVMKLIDNGVRNLRKRQVIDVAESPGRDGAYWGIRSAVAESPARGHLDCDPDATRRLAELPTRLAKVDRDRQNALLNWGYAMSDAAVRCWYADVADADPPTGFPFPGGVG